MTNGSDSEANRRGGGGSSANGDPGVASLMRQDVPVVQPATPLALVARTMVEYDLPGLPVVANGELVGIVTETDLISQEATVDVPPVIPFLDAMLVADGGRDFEEEMRRVLATTAGELMTSPVYSIRDVATLTETATLMIDEGIGTVPVIGTDGQIVGIVTRADIVRVLAWLDSDSTAT